MTQLAATDQEVLNPTQNIVAVERLTHALKENAAEDHELYYKISRALFRGVWSSLTCAKICGCCISDCVVITWHMLILCSSLFPQLDMALCKYTRMIVTTA